MTAGDRAWATNGARVPLPGGFVVPGAHGGCRIELDRPVIPLVIAQILRDVAGYPLDDTSVVTCDVRSAPGPDTRLVDTLARLCLGLKRQGRRLRVEGASADLRHLLGLCGLAEAIPCDDLPPR
jgi:hypothetical protein